jgi:nucleobase:cation symporter-1, NCS1 family
MNSREQVARLEINTIQPIPFDARHGKARDLFTVWFGTNLQFLAIVTGALAVTAFHLPFGAAVVGIVAGNLVGAVFMALHAAQGPTLGVPQMVQTRGQFGALGSLLVVGIVIIMYVGFFASNLVMGGEALASLVPGATATPGIALGALLGLVAAVYGHDLIHAYARVMTYVSGAVLLLTAVWIIWVHGLPAGFLTRNSFTWSGFLGIVSTGALWQLSYAPYVSDYSRYMPRDTGARPAFWASYWGCTLGSMLPMILGTVVALTMTGKGSVVAQLALLTQGIAPLVLIAFSVGIAVSNAMNLYCGALCVLTFGQTLFASWSPGAAARTWASFVLTGVALAAALLSKDSFLANYEDFILLLLYVLVPWTAINLVDYYLLRHGDYDVAAFMRRDGGPYGRFNVPAIGCYAFGILVQLPFVASPLYAGPVARLLGGIDLSWIVGLVLISPLYYWLGKRSQSRSEVRLAAAVQAST